MSYYKRDSTIAALFWIRNRMLDDNPTTLGETYGKYDPKWYIKVTNKGLIREYKKGSGSNFKVELYPTSKGLNLLDWIQKLICSEFPYVVCKKESEYIINNINDKITN